MKESPTCYIIEVFKPAEVYDILIPQVNDTCIILKLVHFDNTGDILQ